MKTQNELLQVTGGDGRKGLACSKDGIAYAEAHLLYMHKDAAFLVAGYDNITVLKIGDALLFPVLWAIENTPSHKYPNRIKTFQNYNRTILEGFKVKSEKN